MQETARVLDITGPENALILLAAPGDEVMACGGLIAAACARGQPPFVVILGDGAPDGCAALAHERELASRLACRRLGLPADRLLFAGLRQGAFPAIGTKLFNALKAAMAEVSWRRDCNVILAPDRGDTADAAITWQLAEALAGEIEVTLLASVSMTARPRRGTAMSWRFDTRRWEAQKAEAGLAHGYQSRDAGLETYAALA